MEKVWKITNTGKKERVKFTIAIASNKSPGVFLEKDEYVLSQTRMTTMLDAQVKRGYVKIEEITQPLGIPIGEVVKMNDDQYAAKKVKDYKN